MCFSYKGFLFKELLFELLFIPSPAKLQRDIVTVTLPSVRLFWPLTYEAMTLKINRVSVILRTKYVPSFVKNPLKDVDSSVHKDVTLYKFDPVTLTLFELLFIPSPAKLQRDIVTVTLPSVRPSHPCEHSRINILLCGKNLSLWPWSLTYDLENE
jgi:hypothetical protein